MPETLYGQGPYGGGLYGGADPGVGGEVVGTYIFEPPTVSEAPAGDNVLHYRYRLNRGITVLKQHDGSYVQERWPTGDDIEASAVCYLGGHIYEIDGTEAVALTAAGYGAFISGGPALPGGGGGTTSGIYGSGGYGSGPYGG